MIVLIVNNKDDIKNLTLNISTSSNSKLSLLKLELYIKPKRYKCFKHYIFNYRQTKQIINLMLQGRYYQVFKIFKYIIELAYNRFPINAIIKQDKFTPHYKNSDDIFFNNRITIKTSLKDFVYTEFKKIIDTKNYVL